MATCKVFISSTSTDLRAYRQAAIEVCNMLGLEPIAMEYFGAMDQSAVAACMQKVRESDVYVGIYAHRYGHIPDGATISITEMEFHEAGKCQIQRLCLVVDENHDWPVSAIDFEHRNELQAFKKRLDNTLVRDTFTTVEQFKGRLQLALSEWLKTHPGCGQQITAPSNRVFITNVPPFSPAFVGRESAISELKRRMGVLPHQEKYRQTVIRGWPGVGKTTLVTTLANEKDVREAFPDGILWALAGEKSDPIRELGNWGRLLGAPDVGQAKTDMEAKSRIQAILHNKRLLLIVDDIWNQTDIGPFLVGGEHCFTLFTTRFHDIATTIAMPREVYVLDIMEMDEAKELLTMQAPRFVHQKPQMAENVLNDIERLPLAIIVAGRLLEEELLFFGEAAVQTLVKRIAEGYLLRQRAPANRYNPETGQIPTIQVLLRQSTNRLDPETRDAFMMLGVFAPKPATFDLKAMQAVLGTPDIRPVVRQLINRGLLEPIPETERFQMHALLVMHANALLDEEE